MDFHHGIGLGIRSWIGPIAQTAAPQAKDLKQPASQLKALIDPHFTFGLAAVMIAGSLALIFALLWKNRFSALQQFRLVVTLLAFALSTMSGMLLGVSLDVKAEWQWMVITIAGPGAVWLVATMALTYWWRNEVFIKPVLIGWLPFKEWKSKLGPMHYLFDVEYEQFAIAALFSPVFFRCPQKNKLARPKIHTLMAFYPSTSADAADSDAGLGMVKFQRVAGNATQPPVQIYHVSSSSLPGKAGVESYLFRLVDKEVKEALRRGDKAETWHDIHASQIDCLVVAHYPPDGVPSQGEYIWVDVPKYTAKDHQAKVSVTFLSKRPMATSDDQESRMWEVRHSFSGGDGDEDQDVDVPVAFHLRKRVAPHRRQSNEPLQDFATWFKAFDDFVNSPIPDRSKMKPGQEFLKRLLKDLGDSVGQVAGAMAQGGGAERSSDRTPRPGAAVPEDSADPPGQPARDNEVDHTADRAPDAGARPQGIPDPEAPQGREGGVKPPADLLPVRGAAAPPPEDSGKPEGGASKTRKRASAKGVTFSSVFSTENFPYKCEFTEGGLRNPVVAFVQWK